MPRGRVGFRIFVIDDDEALAVMVRQMLRGMGYLAVSCTKPVDALSLFSRVPERFDAVIVDEIMPGLKGTQLAVQLLKIKDDIPIILITGHGNMISLEQVRDSGVRATLIKPVLREDLKIVLERLLKPTGQGL
jgi:DNA-binding NtrC family response regulator